MATEMDTTSLIRRLINGLRPGQMFATRDCLNFGRRNAVDQALFRMVRNGDIVRLARGVFTKVRRDTVLPSLLEIAAFKAKAFFRRQVQLPKQEKSGAFNFKPKPTPLATDGATSSFGTDTQWLKFKRRSPRKLELSNSLPGLAIRALWELGEGNVTPQLVRRAMGDFGRREMAIIERSCHIMPAWLVDIVVWDKAAWAEELPKSPTAA